MDNTRLFLVLALSFVLMLIWQAWQQDYHPVVPAAGPGTAEAPAASQSPVPQLPATQSPAAPQPVEPEKSTTASGTRVTVRTDVLVAEIDTLGADIKRLDLPAYPVAANTPEVPFRLMDESDGLLFITQGGLLGTEAAPTHESSYVAEQPNYTLAPGQDQLEARFLWSSPDGVSVIKVFTFHRGSYVVDVRYEVHNGRATPWKGRVYGQLQRRAVGKSYFGVYTYTGAAISSPEKRYEKIDFEHMRKEALSRDITDGWAAMLQHYFVAAVLPNRALPFHYYSMSLGEERFAIGLQGPDVTVEPGATGTLDLRYYVGPKLQHLLEQIAPGLDLTVDYGVLWFIAKPIYWLMEKIHWLTGNWGWSIILLTVLIKGAFFHLSATSYKSMAKMRKVQPRLVAIRDRYSKDRARMNEAMMQLYKEEKINPLGGCLPILVQIPVFLALYWVLLESVELRQAPFILWIKDLSTKDPYYVLPVLMGISMFLQQKLNPAPLDPVQARVMQFLPLVFTVFFAVFPSGLVLYWFVNNILSMTQQWVITRQIQGAEQPARAG